MTRARLPVFLLLAVPLCSGCIVGSQVVTPYHAPQTSVVGLLFTDMEAPITFQLNPPPKYEVIGRAHGEASCFGVLGLVLIGKAGFHAAYESACTDAGADALVDYQGDHEVTSFLMFFQFVRFKVAGTAVKAKP
jgi:hypothetical protein